MANSPKTRLQKLIPAAVVSHDIDPWASISFSGERHILIVEPENEQQFLTVMASYDCNNVSGWLICEATTQKLDATRYTVTILLVEDK